MNFGPDESMDDDEIDEDEDAEMDFGEDAGSEDTSRTDEDDDMDEEDDEVDVDDETGESEGAWQDEDDEADLVENGEGEGDEDGDEDDEDDEADDGVIWPEVCMACIHLPSGNSISYRESSKFRERRMRVTTRKESEVPHNSAAIFLCRAEAVITGAPVILGEEEEEDEDEEWTSPQDGYVNGSEPSLVLTLVF